MAALMQVAETVKQSFLEAEQGDLKEIKDFAFRMIRNHQETGTVNIVEHTDGAYITVTVFVPKK